MSIEPKYQKDQINQWLKKLERESWQLELLVSAFTIFLLIQAVGAYSDFLSDISHKYNLEDSILFFVYFFLGLLGLSIRALTVFLIMHLMLRGFWIGAIGLRSVQSNVDFDKLNYSDFFTDRLKKKVISLDNLVVMLDEICSLMFSFAFLIMSILIAFGMYMLVLGVMTFSMSFFVDFFDGWIGTVLGLISAIIIFTYLIFGLVYFIDYFTLGFFKKFKWLSKIYYPFYRFFGVITISVISKSIYYYLISRFSKKRIRIVYLVAGLIILMTVLADYDQYQYYPDNDPERTLLINHYDNLRPQDHYISNVSIQSDVISGGFLKLFIRYDPEDNSRIQGICPDFVPAKKDGFNWSMTFKPTEGGVNLTTQNFEGEDRKKLLECLSSLFSVSINDSSYTELKYYFTHHFSKEQKGLITMIGTSSFNKGENTLHVQKTFLNEEGEEETEDLAFVPFWFE